MVKKSGVNGSGVVDIGIVERGEDERSGDQSTYPLCSSNDADSKRPLTSPSGDSAALDQEDPNKCRKVNKTSAETIMHHVVDDVTLRDREQRRCVEGNLSYVNKCLVS